MQVLKNIEDMTEKLEEIASYLNMDNYTLSSVLHIPVHMENFKKKSQHMIYSMEINHLIQLYKYVEEHKDFLSEYTGTNDIDYFVSIDDIGTELENAYPDTSSLVYQSFLRYKENFETWYVSILED
jgi:NRPS condensation-like uncharacterized protein